VIIFVELKTGLIGSGLSYETQVTRSVNMLHVDNLEPSGIRGDLVEISVDVNTKTMNVKKKILITMFSVDMRLLLLSRYRHGGCYTCRV
jgi:hypothetical protein